MRWKYILHRDMSVLFESLVQTGIRDYTADVLGLDGVVLSGRKIDHGDIYHDERELEQLRLKVRARVDQGNYLEELVVACEKECEDLVAFSKGDKKGSEADVLQTYFDKVCRVMPFLPVFPVVIETVVAEQMGLILSKYATPEHPVRELRETFSTPHMKFAVQKEQESLYRIAGAVQTSPHLNKLFQEKDGQELFDALGETWLATYLQNYVDRYAWVETRHFKGELWTPEIVIDRIKGVLHEDCMGRYRVLLSSWGKSTERIRKLYGELGFTGEDKTRIDTLRKLILLKTQRKDAINRAAYHMHPVFCNVADVTGLDVNDLVYLEPHDIVFLANNPEEAKEYQRKIEARKKGFALIMYDGDVRLFEDSENGVEIATDYSGEDEVRGRRAQPGEVTGLVRIIRNNSQIASLTGTDLMVCGNIHPDYVVELRRISEAGDWQGGIITDEGGVASHAAQLSREFGLPCIIGTGNATSVFQTGDNVYLNATEGYAKKLE